MKTELQVLLFSNGITQDSIEKQVGMYHGALSRKMAGKSPFLWSEVVEICKILGIKNPLTEIFGEK